ncbi:MAG: FAD-binding oxidoreductase [Anaerolineae bacterium]
METADVVIVGGGVIGASVAWRLAQLGCTDVVLLERDVSLSAGSTGRSVGGIRHGFSSAVNVALSLASSAHFRRFTDDTGEPAHFVWNGYLFLLDDEDDLRVFEGEVAMQQSLGVQGVRLVSPDDIKALVPQINVDGLTGGTICASDGVGDPYSICQGYAAAARRAGVRVRTGVAVTGICVEGGRVAVVDTSEGPIACRWVVNCAGPWAAQIGEMAGVDLPIVPLKRQVYITDRFDGLAPDVPMTVDFGPSFYFRREGAGIVFGMTDKTQPPGFDLTLDPAWLSVTIEQALRRVPVLAEARVMRGWAGLYDTTPDGNPILGAVPDVAGFLVAAGFSGHGFMHSPATGQIIAEMIVGREPFIDVSELGIGRFSAAVRREHNVI